MRRLVKLGMTASGLILLVIGAVFTPLPPPFFGIPLLIVGTALVVAGSKTARRTVQGFRHRYPRIFRYLDQVEHRFPAKARYYIKKTHPGALVRKARTASGQRPTDGRKKTPGNVAGS